MANLKINLADPSLIDLLNLQKRDILLTMNCHAVATVQSFNPINQTITATICYTKSVMDFNKKITAIDYPILMDCPVIILGGGTAHLTFPITKGDTCLILFNDRDIDNWFKNGQTAPLATNRLHAFSDGVALIGLNSLSASLTNYDSNRALLKNGVAGVGVSSTKVKVFNSTDTLNLLLQDLVTAIKSLVTATSAITVPVPALGTSGVPINVATITAINTTLTTVATKLSGLLE